MGDLCHTKNSGNSAQFPRVSSPSHYSELRHVTEAKHTLAYKLLLLVASIALFATACGGGGGPSSQESSAAETAASSNEATLALTSDVVSTQFLDTADGSVAQLSEVVTGDRPVLLWYWAPH